MTEQLTPEKAEETVSRIVRLWLWIKKHVGQIITLGLSGALGTNQLATFLKAGYDAWDALSKVADRFGIPMMILFYVVFWALPQERKRELARQNEERAKEELRRNQEREEHRAEVERLRAAQKEMMDRHEVKEERSLLVFENNLKLIMSGVAEFKNDIKTEIRDLKKQVEETGKFGRVGLRPPVPPERPPDTGGQGSG